MHQRLHWELSLRLVRGPRPCEVEARIGTRLPTEWGTDIES